MAKKKAGQSKVNNIKTNKFLPGVFQTDLNKSWLDSTLDQMVSKGPLDNINGYVGSRNGATTNINDSYIEPKFHIPLRTKAQLTPGVVSYNDDLQITNQLTIDDIAHSINTNFDAYNYNSAYNTEIYSYSPPVDVDKLVNFKNYIWAEELPVYESIYTGASKNPLVDSKHRTLYTLTDDNNTFSVEDHMLIKFTGSGWDVAVKDKTFIVTGVGTFVTFEEFRDENTRRVYHSVVPHTQNNDGIWDDSKVHRVIPNKQNKYWQAGSRNFLTLINDYNNDADPLPIFNGFHYTDLKSNPTQLVEGVLIRFDSDDWFYNDAEQKENIYIVDRFSDGKLTLRKVVTATWNVNYWKLSTSPSATASDIAKLKNIAKFDMNGELAWDFGLPVEPILDYIVIAKEDLFHTAWSRANHWVNISTVRKLMTLLPDYNFDDILSNKRRAKRPIIEYNAGINLHNNARHHDYEDDPTYIGAIDFGVVAGDDISVIPVGSTYVYIDSTQDKVYKSTSTTPTTVLTMANNYCLTIKSILNANKLNWQHSDVWYINNKFTLAQQKTKVNQYPLYKFFTDEGVAFEDIVGTNFTGDKIFGYKEGTGTIDPELGLQLSYKDSPKGAEYEFENFILTSKYKNTLQNSENPKITFNKSGQGYNLYKRYDKLETVYRQSGMPAGALTTEQYKITVGDDNLTIPYGYSNWDRTQSFVLHKKNDKFTLSRLNVDTGESLEQDVPSIQTLRKNTNIKVYNLTTETIKYFVPGNTEVTPTTSSQTVGGLVIKKDANNVVEFSLTTDNVSIVVEGKVLSMVTSIDNQDDLNYSITNNGNKIDDSYITINNNNIVISEFAFKENDIIDFSFRSNENKIATTISYPEVMGHNVHNEAIQTFTISETLEHWVSKLNVNPKFDGNSFSENNYSSVTHTPYYGGTLYMRKHDSIMHDINYSNEDIDITGSLVEQGADWISFRNRVLAQVKRLYQINPYTDIKSITDDAISEIIKNKRTIDLHKTSNMLYAEAEVTQTIKITDTSVLAYKTNYIFNGDLNIRDHAYVYLTDTNGKVILQKDTDYTIIGDTIYLTSLSATATELEVVYHNMDSDSFVPASLTKLGLAKGYRPIVSDNVLYTHDGQEYTLTSTANLTDITSADFDVVHAVLLDMENRIYAGLVLQDTMYDAKQYASYTDFLPNTQHSTWYTLNILNNYTEKFYTKWAGIRNVTETNIYDQTDKFTWNYSTIQFNNFETPGHYKGVYTLLFGTATPHLTPWHMLGFGFKPTWWDANYSWTNNTKRTALINALTNGIVSQPGKPVEQDLKYARFNWDWSTRSPVTGTGVLEDPTTVIGLPNSADAAQNFVFGDYGPIEYMWRNSAQGQAVMIDAVLKLNPTTAWTKFFQPGFIKESINGLPQTYYDKQLTATEKYKLPGIVYDKTITKVTVSNSPSGLTTDSEFIIIDDFTSSRARAKFKITYGKITSVSLIDRGINFTGDPIAVHKLGTDIQPITIDFKVNEVPFVANGIAQAQYNFAKRNQKDINHEQLYKNLTTKLIQKVGGFTSKHLLNVFAESSVSGDFQFGQADFDITMYTGKPTQLPTASALFITKGTNGYTVNGISNNKQEFNFYEPNTAGLEYDEITIANSTVKRYKRFVSTPSVIEYNAPVEKIQDVYNFIRGYWMWMETNGYTLEFDKDNSAADFVGWAKTASNNEIYILQIGRKISFKPTHGTVLEYNKLRYTNNDVLSIYNKRLDNSDLSIDRKEGTAYIETKDKEFIGSITSAVLDCEHAIIFEKKTNLGVDVFDDVKDKVQNRLLIKGQRTQDWNGEKKAPGYLVLDNHIVENIDSAVQSVDDIYRTDVDEFNSALGKAKDLTIGNIEKTWTQDLGLNKNVITKMHQGLIGNTGTTTALDRIGRSNILNENGTDISVYEQYMFRQSELGNNDIEEPFEFEITSSDISSSPQIIAIDDSIGEPVELLNVLPEKIVNNKDLTFDTNSFANSQVDILTGGEPLSTETKYKILSADQLSTVWDSNASYANIPTWNNYTSYKLGDEVRHEGQLWECQVDYTGKTEVTANIELRARNAGIAFPSGTVATVAGTTTTFASEKTEYQDIVAVGSITNPTFSPTETLVIDGITVGFSKNKEVPVVTGPAVIRANSGPKQFTDVTGKSITINGVLVDFDNTPTDVIETFTGVDNGIAPAVDLEDTFTLSTVLSGSTYGVSSITVDGTVTTAYTVSGQDIIFTTAPADGAAISVTLVHVANQMTATEIKDFINSVGIPGLTASLVTSFDLLELSYTTTVVGDNLILAASTTNADLGFNPSGGTVQAPSELQIQNDDLVLADIVAQIDATNGLELVTPVAFNNALKLTSTDTKRTLTVSGSAQTLLGLNANYNAGTTQTQIDTTHQQAAVLIQNSLTVANVTDVIVSYISNQIVITSTGDSIDMGTGTFNNIAGFDSGVTNARDAGVVNQFTATKQVGGVAIPHFTALTSDKDPAMFNILVSDDSAFEVKTKGSVATKFFGWNVLQVQPKAGTPLFSKSSDDSGCGICAGTLSRDGNDAEVTTNVAHGFEVGDYVMLLNTDTTPPIDGIHKVTKLGTESTVFYIDEFIEKCGNAVSVLPLITTRFSSEPSTNLALSNPNWNLPNNTLIWEKFNNSQLGTWVHSVSGSNKTFVRSTTRRPSQYDIDNIIIYNQADNTTKVQLEAFDPMRRILPGVAMQNLEYIEVADNAIYNTSTDDVTATDENNAWGTEQVGTRWWDTSKVRYYDYDQGSVSYRTDMWGKLYPGSEIVVWEWIQSTVAPDDYAEAVKSSKEMFGVIATGEAYSVVDNKTNETDYYYTIDKIWNNSTNVYDNVYYFWVKNKTTINNQRSLSAFDVASMIENPTQSGIAWYAVLDGKTFIVDNINYYVEDKNTILQINKAPDKINSHNEWTLVAKDKDIIPGYYIRGIKYNLAGQDLNASKIPYQTLHRFSKYGDNFDEGQTWFNNLYEARRNTATAINGLLKDIWINDQYHNTWNRTAFNKSFPTYLWNWIDYKLKTYTGTFNHTKIIPGAYDLINVDRTYHNVVKVVKRGANNLDRSELYAYNNVTNVWELILKKNVTIELNVDALCPTKGWDADAWDSDRFDQANVGEYWITLITALHEDLFIAHNKHKMNELFFIIVDHVLSSLPQTNWIRKTTYVKLELTSPFDSTTKKYTRDKTNNIIGYVEDVKPYHTKISSTNMRHTTDTEEVKLTVSDTHQLRVSQKYDETLELSPTELLNIIVQTNASGSTHATDSLTFAHIQDNAGTVNTYALTEALETTLSVALNATDTTITVADTTAFANTGTLYVGGELIEYSKTNATTLAITNRAVSNTFAIKGAIGDSVTQVNTTQLTYANPQTTQAYNTTGESILASSTSTQAQELQAEGKGIEL